MQCPTCGMLNNPGRVYCGGCARAIGEVCPVCLFVNEPIDRYCGGCARDLLVAPIEPAPGVRATAVGPAAQTDEVAPAKTPVSLEDLADLTGWIVPGGSAAAPPSGPADATQSDVDSFFQRLAREGEVEIAPPAGPGPVFAPPRSARS